MKNKKRQTKSKSKVSRVVIPKDETAKATKKRSVPRVDTVMAMRRIYDGGWEYDEKVAERRNAAEEGSYIYKVCNVDITPEDASDLFCYHNYDKGQRKLDETWSRTLAKDIATVHNIAFAVGPSAIAEVVNGQHSLWAIVNRGRTTQASVNIHMCRDEQAIADLYATFDVNKKRSLQNAIHAARGANALIYEGKDNLLVKWAGCVAVAENGFSRKKILRESRVSQLERARRPEVQEFARWMDVHVTDGFQRKLVPQGVGSAFYAMWKSDLTNADKFAKGYFTGENLRGRHPALVIRNRMANKPRGEHASTVCRDHAELLYTAWRKFCLGEPLLSVRRTQDLPDPEKWKIYRSAKITLGLNDSTIVV